MADRQQLMHDNLGLAYRAAEFYRRLWGRMDGDEARAVAMLAYVRACVAHQSGRGSLGTLVYHAVKNAFLNELARQAPPIPVAMTDEMHPRVEDRERGALPAWADEVPDHLRPYMQARAMGMTNPQTAAMLRVSRQTVTVRLRELRGWVSARLGESGEPSPAARRARPMRAG